MYLVLRDAVSFECVIIKNALFTKRDACDASLQKGKNVETHHMRLPKCNYAAKDSADLTLASTTINDNNSIRPMAKKPSSIKAESRIS
ncbi:hypothetical protein SAMN05428975_1115 [Mucilaginibacter sp. OK268]|nr:hypothetical protein SAMN05428975_1115 [Mucilaginibacter sp. OK268]